MENTTFRFVETKTIYWKQSHTKNVCAIIYHMCSHFQRYKTLKYVLWNTYCITQLLDFGSLFDSFLRFFSGLCPYLILCSFKFCDFSFSETTCLFGEITSMVLRKQKISRFSYITSTLTSEAREFVRVCHSVHRVEDIHTKYILILPQVGYF